MRLRFWTNRTRSVRSDIAAAREARIESEQRLREAQVNVIYPLREIRRRNHVSELLDSIVARHREGEQGG